GRDRGALVLGHIPVHLQFPVREVHRGSTGCLRSHIRGRFGRGGAGWRIPHPIGRTDREGVGGAVIQPADGAGGGTARLRPTVVLHGVTTDGRAVVVRR